MPILDHIGISVTNLAKSTEFYKKALAPLGIEVVMEVPNITVGFGKPGKPDFWIADSHGTKPTRTHVAFAASGRAAVKAFYEAAIAAGATDNGPPGVREHYHPHYFAAFVTCPDGHGIEAVCHEAYLG
jgi:catechol 2,3-dioxygenase-like lactoylglutathione lyase family enzyme